MAQTLALHTDAVSASDRWTSAAWTSPASAAEAGAIAVNGVALLLLLVPMNMHVPPVESAGDTDVVCRSSRETPPPPPPPKPVEVIQRRAVPCPRPRRRQPQKSSAATADRRSAARTTCAVDAVQVAEARHQPRSNAITAAAGGRAPRIRDRPAAALSRRRDPQRAHRHGDAAGAGGCRRQADRRADRTQQWPPRAGRRRQETVLAKWRFRPAMQDGRTVQAIGLIPVDFHLDR